LKSLSLKKQKKSDRELNVLYGVVDLYIKTSKPVGSNTLRENGFEDLSSATIRNYFAKLEEMGFLHQPHTSGGRLPTTRAFKLFANHVRKQGKIPAAHKKALEKIASRSTKKIFECLQNAAETLSELGGCAVFLSSPRFEQDSIIDIKLTPIDAQRCLGILITSFGLIHTHTLFLDDKISHHAIRRIEKHLTSQLMKAPSQEPLDAKETVWMKKIYHELMVRFITSYANFFTDDLYTTGLSRLLNCPDFNTAGHIASALSLFENPRSMQEVLSHAQKSNGLCFFIGDDLKPYAPQSEGCAVITIPYKINQLCVGAIGVLTSERCDYASLFALLESFSEALSEALTESTYVYKISWKSGSEAKLALPKTSGSEPMPFHLEHKNSKGSP